jgi:hypothetical protein
MPMLAGVLLVTACSAGPGGPGPGSRTSSGNSAGSAGSSPAQLPPSGSPTPGAGSNAGADQDGITLAFGGDVHFANQLATVLTDPQTGLADLKPGLAGADLAMVNLETAITTRGTPAPKQFHFRAPPAALGALAAAGVDVVTMANNHAVDYGAAGLTDTLAAQRTSPIPVVGIGPDAARAYAPAYLTVRGARVAVFGATQILDWTLANWAATASRPGVAIATSPGRLAASIRAARAKADLVVVYLHWGTDYTGCPNSLQRSTAAALSAAGADVIVGSHAHRLQGAGWLNGSFVDYGLGNFVWWRRNSVPESTTGVLTLTARPTGSTNRRWRVTGASWLPMMLSADGLPREVTGADRNAAIAGWQAGRGCARLSGTPATAADTADTADAADAPGG